jgi:hypothetical protein
MEAPWGRRRLYREDIDLGRIREEDGSYRDNPREEVAEPAQANLISSVVGPDFAYEALGGLAPKMHMPVIDIDLPCTLVPSTTEGHFHLYIDKEVSWSDYCRLLSAMVDCGIVEEGYYAAALRRGATFVRMPGVRKPLPPAGRCASRRPLCGPGRQYGE